MANCCPAGLAELDAARRGAPVHRHAGPACLRRRAVDRRAADLALGHVRLDETGGRTAVRRVLTLGWVPLPRDRSQRLPGSGPSERRVLPALPAPHPLAGTCSRAPPRGRASKSPRWSSRTWRCWPRSRPSSRCAGWTTGHTWRRAPRGTCCSSRPASSSRRSTPSRCSSRAVARSDAACLPRPVAGRRRWAAWATLTRPFGFVVAIPIAVEAFQRWRDGERSCSPSQGWQ